MKNVINLSHAELAQRVVNVKCKDRISGQEI